MDLLRHSKWWSFGRPIVAVATCVLALLGILGNPDKRWVWILAVFCAVVIVLWEGMAWRREASAKGRLGASYEVVVNRVLSLIADLSDLTAGKFDLWVVDLYLPQASLLRGKRYRRGDLELFMHVTLGDVRAVPPSVTRVHFIGRCFSQRAGRLWWDRSVGPSSGENCWRELTSAQNKEMAGSYGVASVNPVVDNLGKNCIGVLVVHAKREEEVVRKVLGALQQDEGKRRVAAACLDIHGHLQRS